MPCCPNPSSYFPPCLPCSSEAFKRYDESSDFDFYNQPRFVTHIDDPAIGALTKYYADTFPESGNQVLCPPSPPNQNPDAQRKCHLGLSGRLLWRPEARHPPERTGTCVDMGGPRCAPPAHSGGD